MAGRHIRATQKRSGAPGTEVATFAQGPSPPPRGGNRWPRAGAQSSTTTQHPHQRLNSSLFVTIPTGTLPRRNERLMIASRRSCQSRSSRRAPHCRETTAAFAPITMGETTAADNDEGRHPCRFNPRPVALRLPDGDERILVIPRKPLPAQSSRREKKALHFREAEQTSASSTCHHGVIKRGGGFRIEAHIIPHY